MSTLELHSQPKKSISAAVIVLVILPGRCCHYSCFMTEQTHALRGQEPAVFDEEATEPGFTIGFF